MNPLFEPLSDAELVRLDRFLLDRIDEVAGTDGKDEGVLNISELDGLFTALGNGRPGNDPSARAHPRLQQCNALAGA